MNQTQSWLQNVPPAAEIQAHVVAAAAEVMVEAFVLNAAIVSSLSLTAAVPVTSARSVAEVQSRSFILIWTRCCRSDGLNLLTSSRDLKNEGSQATRSVNVKANRGKVNLRQNCFINSSFQVISRTLYLYVNKTASLNLKPKETDKNRSNTENILNLKGI